MRIAGVVSEHASEVVLAAPALVCRVALCLLLVPTVALAGPRVLGPGTIDDAPVIRVVSNTPRGLELEFELPALAVEEIQVNGETFQSLGIPYGGENGEPGQPSLPVLGRLVQIPDEAGVQVETIVEHTDEYDGIRVLPVQDRTDGPFEYDLAAYGRDGYGDVPPARVGDPALMHGLRVAPITFAPVQFNPAQGKLRVIRRMRVTVGFGGRNLTNPGGPDVRPIPESFDHMYRNAVINYDHGGREVVPGTWLVICADDPTLVNSLQPLVTWRRRQGRTAVLATTAQTGTTAAQIKAYIQDAYNTWDPPLEYVVLAGDAGGTYGIPCWYDPYYGGEGDHPYTQLDGTDIVSDVHIGRLSFSSTDFPATIDRIVTKIVHYESTPYLADDPSWFSRAVLCGDPTTPSGYSPVFCMQSIRVQLLENGYAQVDTVFSSPFVSGMTSALNRGDTIFAYRGYLGMSGWSNGNTDALTNGWKMPYCVISTCGTGSFASGTAVNEEFLRAWDSGSTPQRPRGAVGATGTATIHTHTRFNNCYVHGNVGGLIYEGNYTMGAAHTRGKLDLYLNYWLAGLQDYVTQFAYWNNLMGDPACEVFTGFPAPMTVSAPPGVAVGASSVVVTVMDSAMPLAEARVCLWKGTETYVTGETDVSGRCELPVSLPTAGDLLLTVTQHNHYPYQATIPVAAPPRFVGVEAFTVDDDSAPPSEGNGDGQVNPGETIQLPVQVRNFGSETAGGLTGVLTSDDPYVSVLSDGSAFPDLDPGEAGWGTSEFVLRTDPGCPHDHALRLALDITGGADSWHSLITVPAVSAELQYIAHHWYNAGPNGLLDPGETVGLSIELQNTGALAAVSPVVSLVSSSVYLDAPVSDGTYPTIAPGATGENTAARFTVHASSSCYNGYLAQVKLLAQFSGGIRDTVLLSLPVGTRTTTDPTGPDAYGYLAYDNTDLSYPQHPTYSWIELDPNQGGGGTEIVLGDSGAHQDKTRTVTLPFPFRYYGQTFTTAAVCSNGWIQLGSTYVVNYRNWTLPSYGGPNGVIAVFWDDLYQRSGSSPAARCYQKYDANSHTWIVEWLNFTNLFNWNSPETFEAIFYDPAWHATATGDGIIDFQYRAFNNVDTEDGYATVGIEKPDNSDALLYTYFNRYTPGSALAEGSQRAVRFVPTRENPAAAGGRSPALRLSLEASNPTLPGGTLAFTVARSGIAALKVYDVQGRLLRILVDQALTAGRHVTYWDGRDDRGGTVPSGIYFYRLDCGEESVTRKSVLVR